MTDLKDPQPGTLEYADPNRRYFVSIRDGNKHGFLAGPYDDFGQAKAAQPLARNKAHDANPAQAAFASYGVCSVTLDVLDKVKPVFGKLDPSAPPVEEPQGKGRKIAHYVH